MIINVGEEDVRIDFINKKEFSLNKRTSGVLELYEVHPLLINYNENILTTYINSKPDNAESFVSDIKSAIDKRTLGWRNWTSYVNDKYINFDLETFLMNVDKGSGKFLEAPFSITQDVIKVCNNHHVQVKTFGDKLIPSDFKLIMVEDDYVIAKDFKKHNTFSES